jgi:hypothetical protein
MLETVVEFDRDSAPNQRSEARVDEPEVLPDPAPLDVAPLGREASSTTRARLTTTEARALVANGSIERLCLWGEPGDMRLFWPRLQRILGNRVQHIIKPDRVEHFNGRIRFDLYVEKVATEWLIKAIKAGAKKKGWTSWYVRQHIPYVERVGFVVLPESHHWSSVTPHRLQPRRKESGKGSL